MKKLIEGHELNIWISEVKGDTTSTKFKLCRTIFKLSTMIKSSLKNYSDGKKRQSEVKKTKIIFLIFNKAANKISSSVSSQLCLYFSKSSRRNNLGT